VGGWSGSASTSAKQTSSAGFGEEWYQVKSWEWPLQYVFFLHELSWVQFKMPPGRVYSAQHVKWRVWKHERQRK
jgi:hypothetical protein